MALVLVACGAGKSQSSEGTNSNAATSSMAGTSAKVIEVTMKDFAFKPSTLTVPAGKKVTLKFTNTGKVEHEFMAGKKMAGEGEGFENDLFAGVSVKKQNPDETAEEGEHSEEDEHAEEGEEHAEEDEHAGGEEHGEEHHGTMLALKSGESGSMTFTLPPSKAGTYTIACFETTGQKHYKLGMKGTLKVTASGQK
ncbi:MAG: cupredoxin domain-containing protein [Salinibacter sp.]|uniref:cupredoxin domain-containing protein n=1 Tax=Salinibacter sp. TaxID=2065818 RepID=UPI0035D4559D